MNLVSELRHGSRIIYLNPYRSNVELSATALPTVQCRDEIDTISHIDFQLVFPKLQLSSRSFQKC